MPDIIIPLQKFWWRFHHSVKALKRESGENPEQSRCCNSLFKNSHKTYTTGIIPGRLCE